MVPDEGQPTAPEQSQNAPAPLKGGPRRSRRGGRRHSKRREPRSQALPPGDAIVAESSIPAVEQAEHRREPTAQKPRRYSEPDNEPITPSITTAIEQVNKIIDELKHSLDEMEEVLETLELAERQKIDDAREIESLQRALRQLHRPPPGGGPPRR